MAIATIYKGIEYRSRLEARWASFFDKIGWQHTYEPFDGDGYIPDFQIHGDRPMLVEIKPAAGLTDYQAPINKMVAGLEHHWEHDLLILGVDPFPKLENSWYQSQFPSAGLIGEPTGSWRIDWWFDTANWMCCGECKNISAFHDTASYTCRPCGHGHGDHMMVNADIITLKGAWASATNDVKWRGSDVA